MKNEGEVSHQNEEHTSHITTTNIITFRRRLRAGQTPQRSPFLASLVQVSSYVESNHVLYLAPSSALRRFAIFSTRLAVSGDSAPPSPDIPATISSWFFLFFLASRYCSLALGLAGAAAVLLLLLLLVLLLEVYHSMNS